jgi:transcriptional regulator with XRE-family HTH domain
MDRLKQLRKEKGIMQKEIATYLNVALGTYSRYESGKIIVTPTILKKLSNYYNVAVDYIIGNIDYPLTKTKMEALNRLSSEDLAFLFKNKEFSYSANNELNELLNDITFEELSKIIKIMRIDNV